tara:strand:+ start:203 stop:580 length:378 start_codon:yes stop_codon:yes gene_type:complete
MILKALVGPVSDLAGQWMKQRSEKGQAKHKAKMEVIKNTANWESSMADASKDSWKDEFWTVVLALPVFAITYAIVVDDPMILDRVSYAFEVLGELPEWYQYLLFLCVSAAFGVRGAKGLMNMRKK